MADLYANENFPFETVSVLRGLGHNVLTSRDAGNANQGVPDEQVLAFAIAQNRAVVTQNRRHFVRLHKRNANHAGIIICSKDDDFAALARRVHNYIALNIPLPGKLIRVNLS
jgi:predicted nuclease of predicted toxin-antitoxin system